jgi:4-alpha-glucanotransferase
MTGVGEADIVGEDLGCVPEYVRPHLESLDIAGFRIPHWDSDHGQVVKGSRFPECSFATFATHDHEPIAALWESFRLDAIGATAVEPEDQGKSRESIRLMAEFGGIVIDPENPPPFDFSIRWQLLDSLLASRSRYAALMITDLFGFFDRYNKPGTVGKHNWSYRLPFTCPQMRNNPTLRADLERLRHCIAAHRPPSSIIS